MDIDEALALLRKEPSGVLTLHDGKRPVGALINMTVAQEIAELQKRSGIKPLTSQRPTRKERKRKAALREKEPRSRTGKPKLYHYKPYRSIGGRYG